MNEYKVYIDTNSKFTYAVVTSRDPVAPNGCPIDNDPPLIFILSKSMAPTFLDQPFSLANMSLSIAAKLDKICPAKASWISNTPKSLIDILLRCKIS